MMNRPGQRPPTGGPQFQGGRQQDQNAPFSPQDIKAIIQDGNSEKLVTWAKTLGESMAREVTAAQIRGIFGSVRQIEMKWPRQADEAERKAAIRQLLLLKPKMAYAARRNRGVENLERVLTPAIDLIDGQRERFANFVDFFEAIVAYHKT